MKGENSVANLPEPDLVGAAVDKRPSTEVNGIRIVRNISALAIGHVGTNILGFVAFAYIARVLGPDGFGLINFASAILAYFSLIATMGIPNLASREIARHPADTSKIVGSMLLTRLVLSVVAVLILIALLPFLAPTAAMRAVLALLALNLFISVGSINWAYAGVEHLTMPAVAGMAGTAVHLGLVLWLVRTESDVIPAVLASLVGAMVPAVIQLHDFHRKYHIVVKFDWSTVEQIFKSSLPFAVSAVMIQVYYNIDSVILGYLKGPAEVGYYNAAYKVILFINGFTGLYVQSIYPVISRLYANDTTSVRPFLRQALNLVAALVIPLGIGGTIVAPQLMVLLFGSAYAQSALPFQILIWSVVIIAFSVHYGNTLLACNGERTYTWGVALGAVVNLVTNVIFIPLFGAPAAAATTVLAEAAVMAFMVFAMANRIGFYGPDPKVVWKAVLNAIFMGAIVLVLSNRVNVILAVVLGAMSYSVLALVTQTIPMRALRAFYVGTIGTNIKR